jgi:hypothetical protein
MKKSILLSLFFILFASFAVMAQEEAEAEIEELDAPPSLDELLEQPKDIKVEIVDNFTKASFDFYNKVIEVRKAGEANGWPEQGVKVATFGKEYFGLAKAAIMLAKDIKTVPKLKIPFAMKNFIMSKKALSHSSAHIKYMKSQFSAEDWAAYEAMAAAEEKAEGEEAPAEDGDGEGDGGN